MILVEQSGLVQNLPTRSFYAASTNYLARNIKWT